MYIGFFSQSVLATKLNILTEHLAPYQIVTDNSITGLSTEIVKATLKETPYEYNITAYPWALAYNMSLRSKNTCIYSLARIPQREPMFKWIGHIVFSSISLYAEKNSHIVISNLEDAKKYNIAVIRDDVTHQFLLSKGFVENKNLYVVNKYDALLKLLDLSSRNIDLVILNDDLLKNRIKDLDVTSAYKRTYQFKELTLDFYFACSLETEPEIVDNLIKTMQALDKKGTFSRIKDKWREKMVNLID
jgi:polar amino acid transport system substrate-binding protein